MKTGPVIRELTCPPGTTQDDGPQTPGEVDPGSPSKKPGGRYVSAGQSRPLHCLHRLKPVPPTKLQASKGSKAGWFQWPASPSIAPAWAHGETNRLVTRGAD